MEMFPAGTQKPASSPLCGGMLKPCMPPCWLISQVPELWIRHNHTWPPPGELLDGSAGGRGSSLSAPSLICALWSGALSSLEVQEPCGCVPAQSHDPKSVYCHVPHIPQSWYLHSALFPAVQSIGGVEWNLVEPGFSFPWLLRLSADSQPLPVSTIYPTQCSAMTAG